MRDYAELVNDVETTSTFVSDPYIKALLRRAADAIEELQAAVPRWISVEERLPEDYKTVLCWYEYYHRSKEKVLPEWGIGYIINGRWGGDVSNGRDCKVLYWCPLPEPPKEDA